jgi:hypothetical protein
VGRSAADDDVVHQGGGPRPVDQVLEPFSQVVGQQAGGEEFQSQAEPAEQRGQRGDGENGAERPELHDQPQRPVQPRGKRVDGVEKTGLDARNRFERSDH